MKSTQVLISQRQPATPLEAPQSPYPTHNIQPPKPVEQSPSSSGPTIKKSSYDKSSLHKALDNWGDLFKYSLPTIRNFSDTLPIYISELLISIGIVALWLGLAMRNWNWGIFGGSIGGSILLFLCGFINSSFIKLSVASIFGISWGVLLFLLYFALITSTDTTMPGFTLWIISIISLGLFHVGSSIHCYLFKEVS